MLPFNPSRLWAVAERDLRRFRRNTKLFIPMILMPIIYLVILGKSMGGDLHNIPVAVVVQDQGALATEVVAHVQALEQSRQLFRISREATPEAAMQRLREGDYRAVIVVPPDFSEKFTRGQSTALGLALDNTDNTSASAVEAELRRATGQVTLEELGADREPPGIRVERVDTYGHKEFMQYLVPAVIALALFFIAMLAGGIILVDDRARGIHEGYFVTPLTSIDLIGGLTLSATLLALLVGTLVLISSLLIARVPLIGGWRTLLLTECAIFLLAVSLILFMFTLMARVSNPLTPRALFGILNVLTFFPSGALYPTESYPPWLTALSVIFPMRYAVHALRSLLLKGVGFGAVMGDFLAMGTFALIMMVLASTLFKRTL